MEEKIKLITNYIGERVHVIMKDGKNIDGALAFYNYEQQIIYLSSYVVFNKDNDQVLKEGKFLVINQREWSTLEIK